MGFVLPPRLTLLAMSHSNNWLKMHGYHVMPRDIKNKYEVSMFCLKDFMSSENFQKECECEWRTE